MARTEDLVKSILEGKNVRDVVGSALEEAATVTKKVVRQGKVVKKKFKKVKKKRILSAAQKRAIKKAQSKSQSSAARTMRKRSLNKAKTFESVEQDDIVVTCPLCGSQEMSLAQDEETGDTIFVCDDCGKEFSLVDNEVLSAMIGSDDEDDDDLEIEIEDDSEDEEAPEDDDEAGLEEGCGDGEDDEGLEEGCGDGEDDDETTFYFED